MIRRTIIIPMAVISMLVYSCYSPSPLVEGNSRIEIKCAAIVGEVHFDAVAEGETIPAAKRDFSWVIYGKTNLDVPVPPYEYAVRANRQEIKRVAFNSAGQKKTIWYYTAVVLHRSTF